MTRGEINDRPCGNPLLAEWLFEWTEELQQRNAKAHRTYKIAWESMKACPITFEHPSEAEKLHGIGPAIVKKLTKKLEKHCEENGLPMPLEPARRRAAKRARELADATQADIEVTFEESPPQNRRKRREPAMYVPRYRSGAYAIMVALSKMDPDAPRGLTKPEVQELAQPYCDTSMTVPEDPSKFYTAWKGVHTLIDKDLVEERGRPQKRYRLTDSGWVLATSLANQLGERSNDNRGSDSGSVVESLPAPNLQSSSSSSNPSLSTGTKRKKRNNALEECEPSPLLTSQLSVTSPQPTGNARRGAAAEAAALAAQRRQQAIAQNTAIDLDSDIEILSETGTAVLAASTSDPPLSSRRLESTGTGLNSLLTPIIIPPSAYSIELIIDNREVRSRRDRDYIQDELARKGVSPVTRPLEVGDALWVAVVNDQSLIAKYGEEVGPEVMLDWIIERKRMDDLIGSIKDGRFLEQKFRLHKSGVENVIYCIEDISLGDQQKEQYGEAMNTAIAATQLTNGFFVKRTAKLDDTISYLARLTMHIRLMYAGKALRIIPSEHLDPRTYLSLLKSLKGQGQEPHNITLRNFSSLASKSETVTLKDQFLKFLMCIKGVSGDKALTLAKKWPTPNALLEAYRSCGPENKVLLAKEGTDESFNVGRKMIGKALSEKIYEVWGEDS